MRRSAKSAIPADQNGHPEASRLVEKANLEIMSAGGGQFVQKLRNSDEAS